MALIIGNSIRRKGEFFSDTPRQLEDCYNALDVGEGHNYYVGNRAQADVTGFIEYFAKGMADSFASVRQQASKQKSLGQRDQSAVLRKLSPAQHRVLELFRVQMEINAKDFSKPVLMPI